MIAKTGLLVLSNPVHLRVILPTIHKQIKKTLYIHLTTSLLEPFPRYKPEIFTSSMKYSNTIRGIYADASALCENLDIRVLLSSLKYNTVNTINTSQQVDTVIFDKVHEKTHIDSYIKSVNNKIDDYNIWILEGHRIADCSELPKDRDCKNYKHCVLGGTFDRLHTGHKILLSEAVLYAEETVTVGVTDSNMLTGKLLWELVDPIQTRLKETQTFLTDVCPELKYNVVPIRDPFGPTQTDPTMDMIIVSAETLRGGEKVNEIRKKNSLNILEINCVDVLDSANQYEHEEAKISSSNNRIRLLGTLLKAPNRNLATTNPYVIGLTGGIASGKSSVCQRLAGLGAEIIDCDKIGHGIYKKEKPCFKEIVEEFGEEVIGKDGEIDRKILGGIVFADPSKLQRLNEIVWPGIAKEVDTIIKCTPISDNKQKILVVEAAILLRAGWEKFCHEVWSCIIPQDEAVKRIKDRNKLSEEEAMKRIKNQQPNLEVVAKSNVVLSTYWERSYTQVLVQRAWNNLQQRLENKTKNE